MADCRLSLQFTPDTHWSNYGQSGVRAGFEGSPADHSSLAFFTRSDMEPVPLAHQTWTGRTFAAYWFSDLVNAGSWTQISSFVGLGMTWWEGVLATFIGGFLIAIAIVFNGIAGARLHTPFAVSSRAAFGYYLSRFAVVSRMGAFLLGSPPARFLV